MGSSCDRYFTKCRLYMSGNRTTHLGNPLNPETIFEKSSSIVQISDRTARAGGASDKPRSPATKAISRVSKEARRTDRSEPQLRLGVGHGFTLTLGTGDVPGHKLVSGRARLNGLRLPPLPPPATTACSRSSSSVRTGLGGARP